MHSACVTTLSFLLSYLCQTDKHTVHSTSFIVQVNKTLTKSSLFQGWTRVCFGNSLRMAHGNSSTQRWPYCVLDLKNCLLKSKTLFQNIDFTPCTEYTYFFLTIFLFLILCQLNFYNWKDLILFVIGVIFLKKINPNWCFSSEVLRPYDRNTNNITLKCMNRLCITLEFAHGLCRPEQIPYCLMR